MANIDKTANTIDVAATIVYSKDSKAFKDVTCDTRFTTSELKNAFLNESIVDIAKGTYGNEEDLRIKPSAYVETDRLGKLVFPVPSISTGKNKYSVASNLDVEDPNLILTGEELDKIRINASGYSISITGSSDTDSRRLSSLEFGLNSVLYSTLSGLGDVEKTISFECNGMIGWWTSGSLQWELSCGSEKRTFNWPYYTQERISLTVRENDTLKFTFPGISPWIFNIHNIQIELGDTATTFEDYKIIREIKNFSASAVPDEPID